MALLESDDGLPDPASGPSVHRQSRLLLRRPATGVSGHESLSSSEDDESRFSPIRGPFGWIKSWLVSEPGARPSGGEVDDGALSVAVAEFGIDESPELVDLVEAMDESVELEDCKSECARV